MYCTTLSINRSTNKKLPHEIDPPMIILLTDQHQGESAFDLS